MPRIKPSPEQVEQLLARIPEGFIREAIFAQRFRIHNNAHKSIVSAIRTGKVGQDGDLLYDATRLTVEQARSLARWCKPRLPEISDKGIVAGETILDLRKARLDQLQDDAACLALLDKVPAIGYVTTENLVTTPEEAAALERLLAARFLSQRLNYLYDPLRLGFDTINHICHLDNIRSLHRELLNFLEGQPAQTIRTAELPDKFKKELNDLILIGGVIKFEIPYTKDRLSVWLRLAESDEKAAEKIAKKFVREQKAEARRVYDAQWEPMLARCGDVLRSDAREGKTNRTHVIARSYTVARAAKRLGCRDETLAQAIRGNKITPFYDPDGIKRLPAEKIERAFNDPDYALQLIGSEPLKARQIALVSGVHYSTARSRLIKAGISTTNPTWGQVRGKWDLPLTLYEFKEIFKVKRVEWRAERQIAYEREQEQQAEKWRLQAQAETLRREQLRQQLIAIFPTWQHENRANQRIVLHIGPTNSGKTHDALNHLAQAGSGWYLAPLRLLAFEVFDRLNARGIPCTLLTGEEHIRVPGARFTAATIEMFDPAQSGACVIIDEAHMLADPDRGWAWTRAMMEAQAPEIHILGAPIAQHLVKRMASAVNLPLTLVEHNRLTPIRVADYPWSLRQLPARTILVGFSRQLVLGLKVELERMGRSVSVVYGNLPPEVRRRQADRFAAGETEICVATDAVGMGLNLPADNVCFFELEKFDGRKVRTLTTNEVHQIGGRAGRYGLSQEGRIGALTVSDVKRVHELYDAQAQNLSHARIAPTVEALALIPGTLAERLREWATLHSIPESLRSVFDTADMTERIELASMLNPGEVQELGLATALRLINAPTREQTRLYWRRCVSMILRDDPLPLPYIPPATIEDHEDLQAIETCILTADVYLWLSLRREFGRNAPDADRVRASRIEWSLQVDDALLHKVDTTRRCAECGRKLPFDHRYAICNECYTSRRAFRHYSDYDDDFFDEFDEPDDKPIKHVHSVPFVRPANICPLCKASVPENRQARLAHWQETHPEQAELTVTYAAWVIGYSKTELSQKVPFDRRDQNGNLTVRCWKLATLVKVGDSEPSKKAD